MAASDKLLPKRYEVLRELGSGGTSVVYQARDRETGRDVAVKLLAQDRLEDRFAREAERLSQLSHPNLVSFLQVGKHEGRDFLVMEYLPGGDLSSHLRGKDTHEILRAFIAICAGLGYLHSAGIVHRDVKPANILIDEKGRPKLTDLGSARQVDRKTRITKAGSILGTYAYLAPEQIQSQDAGPAADLYSLGVCLFEALTGRRPFTVRNEFKLMQAHLEEPPPSLHKFRPELPSSLESLVASLLEKKPEARPTNAEVVAAMLERCVDDLRTDSKRMLVDSDPDAVIEALSEAQRSVLLAAGYIGERATFEEICATSAFAEDRTDALLESLIEAKLLTCPEQDTFVLTFPRKLILSRFTPRVRDLFQGRMIASGFQGPASSGMTTAGLTTQGESRKVQSPFQQARTRAPEASTPTPTPTSPPKVIPRRAAPSLLMTGLFLVLGLVLSAGWFWNRSAEIVVASLPEQASVIVDGQWRGKTPLRIRGLSPGSHAVRLTLDGYLSEVRDVQAEAMRPVPMDFTLRESRGRLALADVPEDSQLTVDGAIYDPRDLKDLSVLAGKTRIKVVKEGFRPFFQEVTVKAGESSFVKVEMSPIEGYLECSSAPTAATVLLDGQDAGKTPVTLKSLAFGPHKVELVKLGYATHTQTITVADETPDKLHADLQPLGGAVAITTVPAGAEVYIAGVRKGVTPLTVLDLPPGKLKIETSLAGHRQGTGEVEILAGKTVSLDLALIRGRDPEVAESPSPAPSPAPEASPSPQTTSVP